MRVGFLVSSVIALIAWAITPAGAAPFAYITNIGDSTVSVIDTSTDTVTATVPVGSQPLGVAISPTGSRVYITNIGNGTVSVLDTASNSVVATVTVGTTPVGIAAHPNGTRVYVANDDPSGTVSVIDTASNTVVATIPAGGSTNGVTVRPDGTEVYVSEGNGTFFVIDPSTNTVSRTLGGGEASKGIVFSRTTNLVYMGNQGGPGNPAAINTVSVIDPSVPSLITSIAVGNNPYGLAINPAGTRVYAANSNSGGSGSVSVIETTTNTVVATVPVGLLPTGIAVHPDGTRVYVTNQNSNTVSIIDTSTNTVTRTIPVGNGPVSYGQFVGLMCMTDADCNDGNVCTDDHCVGGSCSYTNNSAPCDDGDSCTANDTCQSGRCVGRGPDYDNDGVLDDVEACFCLGTSPDAPVTEKGCSMDQLCPCAAPLGRTGWTDHGEYVRCVRGAGHELFTRGVMSRADRIATVRAAAGTSCGH